MLNYKKLSVVTILELQQKNHLQLSRFGLRTFAYLAPKIWNDLPGELLD